VSVNELVAALRKRAADLFDLSRMEGLVGPADRGWYNLGHRRPTGRIKAD
jgi:hypothetical protein